jgi:hypothetical protein
MVGDAVWWMVPLGVEGSAAAVDEADNAKASCGSGCLPLMLVLQN